MLQFAILAIILEDIGHYLRHRNPPVPSFSSRFRLQSDALSEFGNFDGGQPLRGYIQSLGE